jgi:hypothetical protein
MYFLERTVTLCTQELKAEQKCPCEAGSTFDHYERMRETDGHEQSPSEQTPGHVRRAGGEG